MNMPISQQHHHLSTPSSYSPSSAKDGHVVNALAHTFEHTLSLSPSLYRGVFSFSGVKESGVVQPSLNPHPPHFASSRYLSCRLVPSLA